MAKVLVYLVCWSGDAQRKTLSDSAFSAVQLRSQWLESRQDSATTTGLLHVGESRPVLASLAALPKLAPGCLLVSASARWALGLAPNVVSDRPVTEVAFQDALMPIYLVRSEWGYQLEDVQVDALCLKRRFREREPQDWVIALREEQPAHYDELIEFGCFNESEYRANRSELPEKLVEDIDRFRFAELYPEMNQPVSPVDLLQVLPLWLLHYPMASLGLSVRLSNAFEREEIVMVKDLGRFNDLQLGKIKNLGRKSLVELAQTLTRFAERDHPSTAKTVPQPAEGASLGECIDNTLAALDERERTVLRLRLGLVPGRGIVSLEDVGSELNVSRQRIQQLESKAYQQIIDFYYWDDLIAHKLTQLLVEATSPLTLAELEVRDPWFQGLDDNYPALGRIIEVFTEKAFFTFDLNGVGVVSRIKSEQWRDICREAASYCQSVAGDGHTISMVRSAIETTILRPVSAVEFLDDVLTALKDRLHFAQRESDEEAVLVSFGRSVDDAVRAVLTEAKTPLHHTVVTERVSERMGDVQDEGTVSNALSKIALLFARGTHGLETHLTLEKSRRDELVGLVEEVIVAEGNGRQWHVDELMDRLEGLTELPSEGFDKYVLNIILSDSDELRYLGRQSWTAKSHSNASAKRLDIHDTLVDILRLQGAPMPHAALSDAVTKRRGIGKNSQIHPSQSLLRTERGIWGLYERDFPGSLEEHGDLLEAIAMSLEDRGTGLHESELDAVFVDLGLVRPSGLSTFMVLSLCTRESRFRVVRDLVGLSDWENIRRLTINEAIKRVFAEASEMSSDNLVDRISSLLGRDIDLHDIYSQVQGQGARISDSRWTFPVVEQPAESPVPLTQQRLEIGVSPDSLSRAEIHQVFLDGLGDAVESVASQENWPLDLQIRSNDENLRVRLYAYNLVESDNPGRRREYKVIFRVPNHPTGEYGALDFRDEPLVLLAGYRRNLDTWCFWDATKHYRHKNGGNVQVKPDVVDNAAKGNGLHQLKKNTQHGPEIVLACKTPDLLSCLTERLRLQQTPQFQKPLL